MQMKVVTTFRNSFTATSTRQGAEPFGQTLATLWSETVVAMPPPWLKPKHWLSRRTLAPYPSLCRPAFMPSCGVVSAPLNG